MSLNQGYLTGAPHCPGCNTPVEGWTSVGEGDQSPEPGDMSICGYCSCLMSFYHDDERDTLWLRALELDEIEEALKIPELFIAALAAQRFRALKTKH